jgi:hypothetical protein
VTIEQENRDANRMTNPFAAAADSKHMASMIEDFSIE